MSTSSELSRKVGQLDNDVQAIYELISTIEGNQRRHSNRFMELAQVQGEHTVTLAAHGVTLAEHTVTLAEHTVTLAEHTATLAEHGGKLDRIIELLEHRS